MKTIPPATIDDYIATFPANVQEILQQVRATIRKVAPEAVEKIGYGIPTFTLEKKNLVHFAGFDRHIGFYPAPTGMDVFKEELSVYKTGKGSVQFPLDKPMPLDLIARMTEFRVKGMLEELSSKKKSKK